MKSFFVLIEFFVICIKLVIPQEFFITEGDAHKINSYNGDIYYQQYYQDSLGGIYGVVKKTNLNNMVEIETTLPQLPVFANKTNSCIYVDFNSHNVFWQNLDNNSITVLFNTDDNNIYRGTEISFSPTDKNLFFIYDGHISVYNFLADTVLSINFQTGLNISPQWKNDSTLICFTPDTANNFLISEINLANSRVDTILKIPLLNINNFTAAAFNISENYLAYNILTLGGSFYNTISIYDIISNNRLWKDSTDIFGGGDIIEEMSWSPDKNRLALLFNSCCNTYGGILIYDVIQDSLFHNLFNLYEIDTDYTYGKKYNLNWINNDIITYTNTTKNEIFYYDIKKVLPVKHVVKNNVVNEFLIHNYPNPFNPSTTIKYSLPYNSSVSITVYNIMGQEIKSFEMNSQSAGTHSIVWNGRNANGITVASGIYLYRISIKSLENREVFEKTAKMLMLK